MQKNWICTNKGVSFQVFKVRLVIQVILVLMANLVFPVCKGHEVWMDYQVYQVRQACEESMAYQVIVVRKVSLESLGRKVTNI